MKELKCKFCPKCDGKACVGQMPGMGGVRNSENFLLNCRAWSEISTPEFSSRISGRVRLAPMTGGVENVGFAVEREFYTTLVSLCVEKGLKISTGDGTPDEKLLWGLEAVRVAGKRTAVFIKPYENSRIMERFQWAEDVAEVAGVDIDAYGIITMRDKVHLEQKSATQLLELKKFFNSRGIPFALKGIFTIGDLRLAEEVMPDIAFVSNHGGRVETRSGSTAEFLCQNSRLLKKKCGNVWVDGGIRSETAVRKALALGADEVLVGRPLASEALRRTVTK